MRRDERTEDFVGRRRPSGGGGRATVIENISLSTWSLERTSTLEGQPQAQEIESTKKTYSMIAQWRQTLLHPSPGMQVTSDKKQNDSEQDREDDGPFDHVRGLSCRCGQFCWISPSKATTYRTVPPVAIVVTTLSSG